MAIVRNFKLFLNAGSQIPLVIHANQYDSGEQWRFTLYNQDGSVYEPSSGAIVGIKSDGHGIINTGAISGGKVVITETQQMTAAAGKAVFELMIDGGSHGTANFMVLVEPKPGDQADLSESDLSLIQEAINSTTPANIASAVSTWMNDNLAPSEWVIDSSLSTSGAAADAKKTGDEISALKSAIGDLSNLETEDKTDLVSAINEAKQSGDGLTDDIKQALLQIARNVAYIDEHGENYYDDLYDALYAVTAISLNVNSLSFSTLNSTQRLTATTVPEGATVTWSSSDTSIATVDENGLVTVLAYGNAVITATAGKMTATCSVLVASATVTSLSVVYTQSKNVFDTDSLDSLKSDIVLTANWSNGTSTTVADEDYTLSGTLEEGTSTITASYGGKSTTFDVTVIAFAYVWQIGKTVDTANGIRLQDNQYRDRGVVGCNRGEHTVPFVNSSADSGLYPIYIDEGITSLTVTSTTTFDVNVVYYDASSTKASKWTRQYVYTAQASGTTVNIASYAGTKYYLVIVLMKNSANSTNTTITLE